MKKTTVLEKSARWPFCGTKGFTLIEIMVVILILGILAGFALPWYQRAILKSRFQTVLPGARAIAEAQEMYYTAHEKYADNMEDLDIEHSNAEGSVNITIGTEEKYKFVRGYNKEAPFVRYVIYQAHSTNFPNNIHCEAARGNEMAEWLCAEELQGTKIEHGSLDGADYVTYILQGNLEDGSFSQIFYDGENLVITNGDTCQANNTGGCSHSSFTGATCQGNHGGGCPYSSFDASECYGTQNGGNVNSTICGYSTYTNSTCHNDGNDGYVCGRSDYTDHSACYSGPAGGCGHATYSEDSACFSQSYSACNDSSFNNSMCVADGSGGCRANNYTDSTCHAKSAGTSGNRACGSGSTYDHSVCYNESDAMYGCGAATYTSGSVCYSNEHGGCGGRSTFSGGSECYGNASGACGSNTYTGGSVCHATVNGACNSNTYQSGSYCAGSFCPAGSPRQDGTIRTEMGE